MNRDGHKDAVFFIGPEVEHTPAYSKKTLFVVGKPTIDQILRIANEYKTPHIFMGANHSFKSESKDPYWDIVITTLLDKGFWVTLDYQAHEHETVLKMLNAGIWQSRIFVPLLGVRIPKVQISNPNLTIKIDDIDFNATNPGVWCLNHHEVTDSNRFTDWQDYGTDVVIELDDKLTPMPPYNTTSPEEKPSPIDLKNLKPPVYADINKPTIAVEKTLRKSTMVEISDTITDKDLETIKTAFNDAELGLDINAKSSLKADPEEINTSIINNTLEVTAEAYADGAKEDPLGKEVSKKPVKKVKQHD